MKIEDLRKIGENIGREGMSHMAIDCIADCDGSYKNAMELAGKLSVIAKMATCDDYWHEQVLRGEHKMNDICEVKLDKLKEIK